MTTNAKLDCVVTDVVRRFARETTPEEMQARGVRTVRSVSLSRVASLIENAIQTALMQRHLGVVEDHQKAFSEAAREEFVRLIEGGSPQAAPPEAGSALHRLKSQLRTRRETLAEDRKSLLTTIGQPSEADEQLEHQLREVFVNWGGDSERLSPLEQEITQVAVLALRQERGRGAKADLDRRASEIDLLERRVAKLSGELSNTEAELARVLAAKSIDPGLQSVYSEVQGLSEGDQEFERKSELMTALFAANIELRARIDSEEQAALGSSPERMEDQANACFPDKPIAAPLRAVPSTHTERTAASGEAAADGRDWAKLWTRGRRGGVDPSLETGGTTQPEPAAHGLPESTQPSSPADVPVTAEPEAAQAESTYVSAPSWLLISR